MATQEQRNNAGPPTTAEGVTESGVAPTGPNNAVTSPTDALPRTFSTLLNGATAFMSLAGKEWFTSLLNQPTDPPFSHDARFSSEFDRVIRLVVVVILLTAIVVGSVGLFADKTAALQVVAWAMKVLIVAFLIAIAYSLIAFISGVRVCDQENRRKLTVGQSLYTILYIFVPWIPIIAFLWVTAPTGGPLQLLALTLFFYLCFGYMILNFAKAIKRVTGCPWIRVWISVLLPISLILIYLISRPAGTE